MPPPSGFGAGDAAAASSVFVTAAGAGTRVACHATACQRPARFTKVPVFR